MDISVLLPLIRKLQPEILARELVSVQPMQGGDEIFSLRHQPGSELEVSKHEHEHPKQGDRRHALLNGWQRYYGNEWVNETIWWKIKIKGL